MGTVVPPGLFLSLLLVSDALLERTNVLQWGQESILWQVRSQINIEAEENHPSSGRWRDVLFGELIVLLSKWNLRVPFRNNLLIDSFSHFEIKRVKYMIGRQWHGCLWQQRLDLMTELSLRAFALLFLNMTTTWHPGYGFHLVITEHRRGSPVGALWHHSINN